MEQYLRPLFLALFVGVAAFCFGYLLFLLPSLRSRRDRDEHR